MHRLFLGANVLFSAAYRSDAGLLQLWRLKSAILCSSRYALEEAKINLDEEQQRSRLLALSRKLHLYDAIQLSLPRGISLPAKDIPILMAAISARATHLLTGDKRHFGPYLGKRIAGSVVLLPADYLKGLHRT